MKILEIQNLHKSYGNTPVIRDFSLTINQGETVCIMGPSGSGKSSILRCIAGLEPFDAGEIIFDENLILHADASESVVREAQSRIGMVFQNYNLWPQKTVLQNITEPLWLTHGFSNTEAATRGLEVLRQVGLSEKSAAYPDFLSGGQRQRVAIARTLATSPELYLFDEITSALDHESVAQILKILQELSTENKTMLIVTHHQQFAEQVSDRIIYL